MTTLFRDNARRNSNLLDEMKTHNASSSKCNHWSKFQKLIKFRYKIDCKHSYKGCTRKKIPVQ